MLPKINISNIESNDIGRSRAWMLLNAKIRREVPEPTLFTKGQLTK